MTKLRTLRDYYSECIDMLECQLCDYHVGREELLIIAACHRDNRPISSAVSDIMRRNANRALTERFA